MPDTCLTPEQQQAIHEWRSRGMSFTAGKCSTDDFLAIIDALDKRCVAALERNRELEWLVSQSVHEDTYDGGPGSGPTEWYERRDRILGTLDSERIDLHGGEQS